MNLCKKIAISLLSITPFVLVSASVLAKECTGTYYAIEGSPVSGYSLWTFSEDGSVVSSSSAEPVVPFSTAQGNWIAAGDHKINSLTFDFSGPNPNPAYPNVARVEATFKFKPDCSGTVTGQSKFSVISCSVSDGPLCNGFPVATNVPVTLQRVSGN